MGFVGVHDFSVHKREIVRNEMCLSLVVGLRVCSVRSLVHVHIYVLYMYMYLKVAHRQCIYISVVVDLRVAHEGPGLSNSIYHQLKCTCW